MPDVRMDDDPEIAAVADVILSADPGGRRTAAVLRGTFDQLYDGQRTGRYRWDQLFKTEKTHCGTLVEINLRREFRDEFEDGERLDYRVADVEVDCKYSQSLHGWMIPPEARDHVCLVVWASDEEARWSMGLVRAREPYLNTGGNRDRKATLNEAGRNAIVWLFASAELPPNVLLRLDPAEVKRLMSLRSGQQRINELFRIARGLIVGRGVIATVAQQDDYMKRVRDNGGAREKLRREGILVLGHFEAHARIAGQLGLPVPALGELISVRVASTQVGGAGAAEIDGALWRVAREGDAVELAPKLPAIGRRSRGAAE